MNILQTIASGVRGGIEQVAEAYAHGFSGAGSQIITIAELPPELFPNFRAKNSQLIVEPWIAGPWKRWDVPAIIRTRKIMRDNAIEACIFHNGNTVPFLNLCRPRTAPLVSVCHMDKLGRRLDADVIICLTEKQREFALESLGRRARRKLVVTVGNPLSLPPVPDPASYVAKRLIGPQITIGTLCNLEARKGLDVLVRALATVRSRGHNIKLIMGGKGTQKDDLTTLARTLGVDYAVEFAGWIGDRDAFFDRLDIFCLPSRIEPFGLALIEAMSRGIPSLASTTEGPLEIIDRRRIGWLFESENSTDLAGEIVKIISDPSESRSYAQAGLEYVQDHFSTVAIAQKIEDAITQYKAGKRSA